jgi:predicted lipoprotein
LAAAIVAGLFGCKSGGGGPGAGGAGGNIGTAGSTGTGGSAADDGAVAFSRGELLGAFATCAATQSREFRAKAAVLDAAVSAYAATPDTAARDAARQAFNDALDAWQVVDQMQFGPPASVSVLGGKGIRSNIYNWPSVSRCAIEEDIVSRAYESASFPSSLPNRRGLWALEYLLFYEGADTTCTSSSPAAAAYPALAAADRDARKRAYAVVAAHDVLARATALDDAWDPAQMNFVQTLRTAGPGNAVYPTQQAAVESVGLSLFFVDRVVKDLKLAIPLDPTLCPAINPTCFESSFAHRSKENVRANLDGLRRITEGCEARYAGYGFDDLLENVGAVEAAGRLRSTVAAAEAALAAIEETDLIEAMTTDRASVQALREAIAAIATFLKTEMYTVLDFEEASIPTDTDT